MILQQRHELHILPFPPEPRPQLSKPEMKHHIEIKESERRKRKFSAAPKNNQQISAYVQRLYIKYIHTVKSVRAGCGDIRRGRSSTAGSIELKRKREYC
jgi:hypothetical protein